MNLFKNKYCKIFIFVPCVTQCSDSEEDDEDDDDEEEITYKNGHIKFYKTYLIIDEKGNVSENFNTNLLFSNCDKLEVAEKFSNINEIIKCSFTDGNNNVVSNEAEIKSELNKYKMEFVNIKTSETDTPKRYDELIDFIKNNFYDFLLFPKLEGRITFKNKYNQTINSELYKNISTFDVYKKAKKINKENFAYRIFRILHHLIKTNSYFPEKAEKIIKINNDEINHIDDSKNLEIYKKFLENLNDENGKIEIVIDDRYDINVTNVLLSDELSKIYKVEKKKEEDIKDLFVRNYYHESKYSGLQVFLKNHDVFKNTKLKNEDSDKDIEDLNNVTITITDDPDKEVITHKKCTINFEVSKGLFIIDNTKYPASKNIEFSDSGITTETDINDYINKTYFNIKDICTITTQDDNKGKFEDGTVVTVTINKEKEGITTKKDPHKVYVNVKFKVSDTNKFKFKGSLVETNEFDLEFDKDKKITDLLNEITKKLGNKNLKDGYVIEKDNNIVNNNEDKLVDNGTYSITLADNDPNFVEEIKQTPIDEPADKPEDTDKAKKDVLINECKNLLSDIKNLDSSYSEPINEDDSVENLNILKDELTSKLNKLKNKKPEENNNNNNNNNDDSITDNEKGGYSGKKKSNKEKCCKNK